MIISFFRDFLSGPLYTIVVVINLILICAGIGYFAEKSQIRKKEREKFKDSHIAVENVDNKTPNVPLGEVVSSKVSSPIVGDIFNQMANQQANNNMNQQIQNNNQNIKQ